MSGKKGMKHYPESFKEQVRQDYGADTSMRSLSRKYGISMYSAESWCGKRPEVNLRRTAPLKRGRPSAEKSIRYMVIYRNREKYSVSEMCRFFEVSRSGSYDYVKRMDNPDRDGWIRRKISGRTPKLFSVSCRNTIFCLESDGESLHRYPNLLNRDFHADIPNQKWATDISYIRTGQGFLYLSIIRDLYDNSIAAYRTGTEQNNRLVLVTVLQLSADSVENKTDTGGIPMPVCCFICYPGGFFVLSVLFGAL